MKKKHKKKKERGKNMANYLSLSGASLEEAKNRIFAEFIESFRKAASGTGKIKFETEITSVDRKAELRFSELAWIKMNTLVQNYATEIGWHGLCERIEGEDAYLVSDIMVYPQAVTGVTVTPDQIEYQNWLIGQPDEVFNQIRFQGHSHVNMDVSPSTVDTAFYDEIVSQLGPEDFYVFLVINKSGKKHVRIYDMQKNLYFGPADVSVTIRNDGLGVEDLLSDAAAKVTDRKPVSAAPKTAGSTVTAAGLNTAGTAQTYQPKTSSGVKPFGKSQNDNGWYSSGAYGNYGYGYGDWE